MSTVAPGQRADPTTSGVSTPRRTAVATPAARDSVRRARIPRALLPPLWRYPAPRRRVAVSCDALRRASETRDRYFRSRNFRNTQRLRRVPPPLAQHPCGGGHGSLSELSGPPTWVENSSERARAAFFALFVSPTRVFCFCFCCRRAARSFAAGGQGRAKLGQAASREPGLGRSGQEPSQLRHALAVHGPLIISLLTQDRHGTLPFGPRRAPQSPLRPRRALFAQPVCGTGRGLFRAEGGGGGLWSAFRLPGPACCVESVSRTIRAEASISPQTAGSHRCCGKHFVDRERGCVGWVRQRLWCGWNKDAYVWTWLSLSPASRQRRAAAPIPGRAARATPLSTLIVRGEPSVRDPSVIFVIFTISALLTPPPPPTPPTHVLNRVAAQGYKHKVPQVCTR